MSALEAFVWVVGIVVGGATIMNIAGAVAKIKSYNLEIEKHRKEGKNEREDDSEGR